MFLCIYYEPTLVTRILAFGDWSAEKETSHNPENQASIYQWCRIFLSAVPCAYVFGKIVPVKHPYGLIRF